MSMKRKRSDGKNDEDKYYRGDSIALSRNKKFHFGGIFCEEIFE